jgi:ribosomal RNA-processing protein 8
MPLFDVPGWDVAADPVVESHHSSKKRKRRSVDSNDTQTNNSLMSSVDINFDKIMSRFKGAKGAESTTEQSSALSPRKRKLKKEKKEKAKPGDLRTKTISHPMRLQPTGAMHARKASTDSNQSLPPKKKARLSPVVEVRGSSSPSRAEASSKTDEWDHVHPEEASTSTAPGTLTALQKSMKQKLDGARFRYVFDGLFHSRTVNISYSLINEQLYKANSREATQMMKENPTTFQEVNPDSYLHFKLLMQ